VGVAKKNKDFLKKWGFIEMPDPNSKEYHRVYRQMQRDYEKLQKKNRRSADLKFLEIQAKKGRIKENVLRLILLSWFTAILFSDYIYLLTR